MFTGKQPCGTENALALALKQLHTVPTAPRSIDSSIPQLLEEVILRKWRATALSSTIRIV
jgi:ABC-type arginine/histidine transport system permease subunit